MPTIEFFGYGEEECHGVELRIRHLLAGEPFRDDCVFVTSPPSTVRDWDGHERPFVRVSTRSAERAEHFRRLLATVCDLELVQIDFQPMTGADGV
jgi:hypothetical protein